MAPFWRGLSDWSDSWAEHQLIAAARGLPVPAADAPPDPDLLPKPFHVAPTDSTQNLASLTVPMGPRTLSAASDQSGSANGSGIGSPATGTPKSSSFKPRAKALALALSGGSREGSSADLTTTEIKLPQDPFVNGQALEVHLYKDAIDCPICFLSYPPYLNRTRCCDQPICSECFVQIKRSEPHLPEHHPDGQARDPNEGLRAEDPPEMLISQPSACPYCQQPEFGVTYENPPFRRGLSYPLSSGVMGSNTPMSSQSSLHSISHSAAPQPGRRRGHSLSATAPNVITTDRVRPDWATKLAAARAHQARRAAAATALHTAAFLVGGGEQRSILGRGRFGRRNTGSGANTPGQIIVEGEAERSGEGDQNPGWNADGSRRSRMDELEDMMMMEAVRLSLAAEEERKRKEAKALRKEAKKAAKKQAKNPYGGSHSGASGSSLSLGLGRRRGNSSASHLRNESTLDSIVAESSGAAANKAPQNTETPQGASTKDTELSTSMPIPTTRGRGNSHLRQMSNASSLGSSFTDTPVGSFGAPGNPGPSGLASHSEDPDHDVEGGEPMFNFRSLAELVGVNIEDGTPTDAVTGDAETAAGGSSTQQPTKTETAEQTTATSEHIETCTEEASSTHAETAKDSEKETPNSKDTESPADPVPTLSTETTAASDHQPSVAQSKSEAPVGGRRQGLPVEPPASM